MYAIVEVSGVQEKVKAGDELLVGKIQGEINQEITLDKILLISDKDKVTVGTPYIDGAAVKATIKQQTLSKKIDVYKYKAKSRYRRKQGHRQQQTVLKINSIKA